MADEPLDEIAVGAQEADVAADDKPVGPYQRSDAELVQQIHRWIKESHKAFLTRRQEREKEWAALGGDQWEQGDIDRMQAGKRARLTLNLLQTTLAAVEGEERVNRQEIKFYGEETSDDGAATAMNRLLKWIMDQCGGEFALSGQFKNGVAVGEGWVVPEVDYFDDPEGTIKLELVDEAECWPDPLDPDPAGRKSRYFNRAQMKEEDELEARWPGKVADIKTASAGAHDGPENDGKGFRDIYLAPQDLKSPKVYDAATKQWLVVETWWSQIEPGFVVVNEATGQLDELLPDEFEERQAQRKSEQIQYIQNALAGRLQPIAQPVVQGMPAPAAVMPKMPPNLQSKPRNLRCFYQAFTCGDVLLEKRKSPVKTLRRFPYVPFRAIYDKKRKVWIGLLYSLLDPQRQHNVEESAIIQLIQQMPHASWMGPKGSFHNKSEWEQKLAQTGRMLEYNPARGKPEQIETPPIPRHLVELARSRKEAMRDISGVNVELTGQRGNADAGVVMEMKKKAATTVLAPIFDNFRMSKLELGRVLCAYIQTFIPIGRRVRVLGPDAAGWVQMTEDMQLGKFDLKVEETNASINDRIATLTVLQTTLPEWIKSGTPIPPSLVDLLPIEPKIRDDMKRMLAWQLTVNGAMPPAGWNPGDPLPPPPAAAIPGQPPAGEPGVQ